MITCADGWQSTRATENWMKGEKKKKRSEYICSMLIYVPNRVMCGDRGKSAQTHAISWKWTEKNARKNNRTVTVAVVVLHIFFNIGDGIFAKWNSRRNLFRFEMLVFHFCCWSDATVFDGNLIIFIQDLALDDI